MVRRPMAAARTTMVPASTGKRIWFGIADWGTDSSWGRPPITAEKTANVATAAYTGRLLLPAGYYNARVRVALAWVRRPLTSARSS
jgi:hypothetical protein